MVEFRGAADDPKRTFPDAGRSPIMDKNHGFSVDT
jgi:hypothetical protein